MRRAVLSDQQPVAPASIEAPPPGPGRLAAVAGFALDPLGSLAGWRRKYGPVVGLRLPIGPACIVYRPAETQAILQEADRYTYGPQAWVVEPLFGGGIILNTGPEHLANRRLVQPLFDQKHLVGYFELMAETAQQFVAGWREGQVLDLHTTLRQLALEVIMRVVLGAPQGAAELEASFKEIFAIAQRLLRSPLPLDEERVADRGAMVRWVAQRQMIAYRRALDALDGRVYAWIRERQQADGPEARDMLGLLTRTRREDGAPLATEFIRGVVNEFLFAGHETSAALMSFVLYLLARHPEVEGALLREHREVLGDRPPRFDDLSALPQTQAVISEALRLYPPGWMTVRAPREDVTLGGYRVRQGTNIFLCQWLLHRDPAYYPEPDRFLPERWSDPKSTDRRERDGEYAPFWFGRKKCIGYRFARMEATLVLATVLRSFRVELLQGSLRLNVGPTLQPAALRVRLRRRS